MVRLIKPDRPRARDYSSRREQWRLMLLILPLGLVIVLMARLRDPETADRLNRFFAPVEMKPPQAQLVDMAPVQGLFPGIRREQLGSISDNTYFRNSEKAAWFQFIESLLNAPPDRLSAQHGTTVDYTQLVDQPEAYRGRLVNVSGWVRQVTKQVPAQNDLGIESYFRVVIQPEGGVQWPIFVYALQLPRGLTEGEEVKGTVSATGLFFKNLSYPWKDGLGTAPVIVARSIEYSGSEAQEASAGGAGPIAADSWLGTESRKGAESSESGNEMPPAKTFPEVLALAGWTVERLAQFDDDQPLSSEQRAQAIELLRRLRSFDSGSLEDWTRRDISPLQVLSRPDDFRGQLVRLAGRVVNLARNGLSSEDAARLEMSEYFDCTVALDNGQLATVLAARVPRAWLDMDELNEPVTAVALYLKRVPDDGAPAAVWLAKELAWHPTAANGLHVSLGKSILGQLGMDVGLLDNIHVRGRIRAAERQAFYQMLDAAGRIGAGELVGLAEDNLPLVREFWEQELAATEDDSRRRLAKEAIANATAGRFSVAPLFNEPGPQIGQLFVFDGAARRVARVEVGSRLDGEGRSDVARRFGIDHYYEMEIFTEDSQNYPLVFCLRELPAGFPIGGTIHVPVRVAGFFFKDWLYQARGSGQEDGGRGQYAPLLIGRAPLMLAVGQDGKNASRIAWGVLLLAALGGICGVAIWYARGDRRFRESVLAGRFSLPPGQSLNEMNLSSADEPMKDISPADVTTSD